MIKVITYGEISIIPYQIKCEIRKVVYSRNMYFSICFETRLEDTMKCSGKMINLPHVFDWDSDNSCLSTCVKNWQ